MRFTPPSAATAEEFGATLGMPIEQSNVREPAVVPRLVLTLPLILTDKPRHYPTCHSPGYPGGFRELAMGTRGIANQDEKILASDESTLRNEIVSTH